METLDTTTFIEKCTKSYGLLTTRHDGVEIVRNIIFKGTAKPSHGEYKLSTSFANQSVIKLQVYENDSLNEEVSVDECAQMYESCEIKLALGLAKGTPIKVNFDVDGNGILNVTATRDVPVPVKIVRIGEG